MAASGALAASVQANLLEAFASNNLGLSIGIAGFLVPYLAGAVYMLAELGIIDANTKIAGASSGALLTMARCSGLSSDQFMALVNALAGECRARNNCQGRLGEVVQRALKGVVPPGSYRRCSGLATISMSVGRFDPPPSNLMVDKFTSDADMLEAALASSWIPVWSGPAASTTFRGQPAFDGFFTNSQPCPPGVKYCLRISSRNPPWSPKDPAALRDVMGRAASAGPFRPTRLATTPAGGFPNIQTINTASRAAAGQALGQAAAIGVDIAPGIYSPTGMSLKAWEELAIMPGDPAFNQHLYRMGARDARAWAQLTGLEAAAAARRAGGRGGASLAVERGRDTSSSQP